MLVSNNPITRLVNNVLPALSGNKITYNAERNVYLTLGYTSAAGNTYYQAVRLSNRLIVYYDMGQGYCRTFLNGIKLFAWDGQKPHLIGSRTYYCRFFNEHDAKEESVDILYDFFLSQAKMRGVSVDRDAINDASYDMIEETRRQHFLA